MSLRERVFRLIRESTIPLLGLIALILFGTITFSMAEGLPFFDSFYWTITVISTVGFGDITPTTIYGKLIFILLVIFGLSLFGYFITVISSFITEEKVVRTLFSYFVADGGKKLRDHVILIGWNGYIKYAYEEIVANGIKPLVVVEDEDLAKHLAREKVNVVVGSLADPNLYSKINIKDAKAIIIASDDHSKTILHTLKIRKVNNSIPIIAAYSERELEDVLKQAGVTKLVNIPELGGRLLANQVFEPIAAEAAIDLISRGNLDLSEETIPSSLDGKNISELKRAGLTSKIISIKRRGVIIPNPDDDFVLNTGDEVVLLGVSKELDKDKELIKGKYGSFKDK